MNSITGNMDQVIADSIAITLEKQEGLISVYEYEESHWLHSNWSYVNKSGYLIDDVYSCHSPASVDDLSMRMYQIRKAALLKEKKEKLEEVYVGMREDYKYMKTHWSELEGIADTYGFAVNREYDKRLKALRYKHSITLNPPSGVAVHILDYLLEDD